MRLINVRNHEFQEFFDKRIPPYAIVSHRWGDSELSFKDFRRVIEKGFEEFRRVTKKDESGYTKIIGACDLARLRGLEWIWIDSCCIDKRSSAELSEAINSMYTWYERSVECYVYMADVSFDLFEEDEDCRLDSFRQSDWFTRGWTLQELIAPGLCIFLDYRWRIIGRKSELFNELGRITQIDPLVLNDTDRLKSKAPSQIMSWASMRKTTRAEDTAYCLMGLFNINMPLLYGEGGSRAFVRLQQEILKTTDDESLFDWGVRDDSDLADADPVRRTGLLATSPSAFANDRELYPPSPPYRPPPDPYLPVDPLDPWDFSERYLPMSLPALASVENKTANPPYNCSRWPPITESTIGNPFITTKNKFILNRVATKITHEGWESYIVDLDCYPRNKFWSSIVLELDTNSGLAFRVHYHGHGEHLRRRIGMMQPLNVGKMEFCIPQWEEY